MLSNKLLFLPKHKVLHLSFMLTPGYYSIEVQSKQDFACGYYSIEVQSKQDFACDFK